MRVGLLGMLLVASASYQETAASQTFFGFIRHGDAQVGISVGEAPRHLAILADPTLGTTLSVSANSMGELWIRPSHKWATAICYWLDSDGLMSKFAKLGETSRSYADCTRLVVLMPRSDTCSVQQFLEKTGFLVGGLRFASWLHKLNRKDEFAVVTFSYSASVAQGPRARL